MRHEVAEAIGEAMRAVWECSKCARQSHRRAAPSGVVRDAILLSLHRLFHAMVDRAGIDLNFTDDPIERVRRALAAIKIAEWMLLEQMKNTLFKSQPEKKNESNEKHDNSSTPNN